MGDKEPKTIKELILIGLYFNIEDLNMKTIANHERCYMLINWKIDVLWPCEFGCHLKAVCWSEWVNNFPQNASISC